MIIEDIKLLRLYGNHVIQNGPILKQLTRCKRHHVINLLYGYYWVCQSAFFQSFIEFHPLNFSMKSNKTCPRALMIDGQKLLLGLLWIPNFNYPSNV